MLGGACGSLAYALFPASTAGPGAYALVGMGADALPHRRLLGQWDLKQRAGRRPNGLGIPGIH